MADKTMLAMPGGKPIAVPKALKRLVQMLLSMALTSLVVLVVLMVNSMMVGKGTTAHGFNLWLAFIRRPDIFTIMALTSIVTVSMVYWQRDQERR